MRLPPVCRDCGGAPLDALGRRWLGDDAPAGSSPPLLGEPAAGEVIALNDGQRGFPLATDQSYARFLGASLTFGALSTYALRCT